MLRRTFIALTCAFFCSLSAPLGAQDTPPANPQPASPSDPPFWARPRPAPPTADCACDKQAPTPVASARNPAILSGLGVFAVMILAFVLWRRRQKPADDVAAAYARAAALTVPSTAAAPTGQPTAHTPMSEGFDPRARRMLQQWPKAGDAPSEDLQLTDPRNVQVELAQAEPEAESAAKAFYAEIAASLEAALRKEPERQDLRRKLLEIYFSARQTHEFVNLAHDYLDRNHGLRDQFWPDIGAMGARLAPDHGMFQEFAGEGKRTRPVVARQVQLRRFHERNVDQGKMYEAQQALVTDFQRLKNDGAFQTALAQLLADGARRPAPLTASPELAYVADGAQIFIKHEDRRRFHDDVLMNALGQILLAQKRGCKRVVTATRDGIHGHAVAGAAARIGMDCMIYIAERDLNRYYARVLSMRRLGAHIRPIPQRDGQGETIDPRRSAMEAWLDDPASTQYVSGLTAGPSPFPEMVREFLAVVGRESVEQVRQLAGGPPAAVVTGVCDGHLGLGLLQGFLDQASVQLFCVEDKPPPPRPEATGDSSFTEPPPSGLLARREHRWLRETGRVNYVSGEDQETLRVIEQFHSTGTTLFTQSARTLAYARAAARRRERREAIVVLLTNQEGADFRAPRSDW